MANPVKQLFKLAGKVFDDIEQSGKDLLVDIFPDTTTNLLGDYERVYALKSTGTTAERRARIITAIRAQGGLSKSYFEGLGNTLGDGVFTVAITEGNDSGFIVHKWSQNTSPKGSGTLLGGALYEAVDDNPYRPTVTVTGTITEAQKTELEKLFDRLKPAWTVFVYVYP